MIPYLSSFCFYFCFPLFFFFFKIDTSPFVLPSSSSPLCVDYNCYFIYIQSLTSWFSLPYVLRILFYFNFNVFILFVVFVLLFLCVFLVLLMSTVLFRFSFIFGFLFFVFSSSFFYYYTFLLMFFYCFFLSCLCGILLFCFFTSSFYAFNLIAGGESNVSSFLLLP
jgi:hypothetical protein